MKINHISIIIFSIYFFSCSAPEQIATFKARNLKNIDSVSDQYIVYCLPQTTLRINFEVTYIEEVPGPYMDFAEILLGLDNVIEAHNDYYFISDVKIDEFPEPDFNQYYVVEFNDMKQENYFQLSENDFPVSYH